MPLHSNSEAWETLWTCSLQISIQCSKAKVYGAGLLSSIGESVDALKKKVAKLPYSIDAIDYNFDITKPQPQLFVTPNFKHLTNVLEEFANQMALRTGGLDGILKAIESGATATLEYSSGLQVSGTFTDVIIHKGSPVYINTTGPTTLNFDDQMLPGEDPEKHPHGFGSPIGKIKGTLVPTRFLTNNELSKLGIKEGVSSSFEFESGIKVVGQLQKIVRKDGKLILLSFTNCLVTHHGRTLFEPGWGQYDMAVGENIVSAYSGPADAEGFGLTYEPPKEKTHQIVYDQITLDLHKLYDNVRDVREKRKSSDLLSNTWNQLISNYPEEWLLPTEIYEISKSDDNLVKLSKDVKNYLIEKRLSFRDSATIIDNVLQ